MADEQEAIAPTELDTPAIEAEAETPELPETILDPGEEAEAEAAEGETEAEGEGEGESEPEFVLIERNGKQYQVPKELEGEFLMQSDYTKKTQETSALRKELEAREAALSQQSEASEEDLRDRSVLFGVEQALKQYEGVDWVNLWQTDPVAAGQHQAYLQQLEKQRAELTGNISKRSDERTEKAQQDLAKRVQETNAFAAKEIPGWKPELTDKLIAFAGEMEVPEQRLKDLWSPTFYKLLHRAYLGEQSLKKQSAAIKPAPQPIAPLTTVTPKASPAARRSLTDLAKAGDIEAYAAARRAGRG